MPTVTISMNGHVFHNQSTEPQSVLDLLNKACIKISTACTGHGYCGLCRIQLLLGQATELTAIERHKLSSAQIAQGIRLACQIQPLSDIKINIEHSRNTLAWKVLFHIDKTTLTAKDDYGIAFDLGTTQLRVSLWNITQHRRVVAWLAFNPQYCFGADILSRLSIAQDSPAQACQMRFLIQQALKKLIAVIVKLPLSLHQLKTLQIVGNTPMLAIIAEKNYLQLFDPQYGAEPVDCQIDATTQWQQQLGLSCVTQIATVPAIAGFIGSDLFAAVISSGLTNHTDCRLLIDFGTNSEMALWDGQTLWVSSVPGGPAFEGSGISCGMPAGKGAIYQLIRRNDYAWDYQVIGQGPALGLCGSALIDAIAHLLTGKQLKRNGRFSDPAVQEISLPVKNTASLALTKQDIDIFQRAKAATAAAIVQVFAHAGIKLDKLAQLYVCGAFGRFLTIKNAQTIGLLPILAEEKVQLLEHAALQGCELLLSTPDNAHIQTLRARIKMVNMAYARDFDECFVQNLYLQPIEF